MEECAEIEKGLIYIASRRFSAAKQRYFKVRADSGALLMRKAAANGTVELASNTMPK